MLKNEEGEGGRKGGEDYSHAAGRWGGGDGKERKRDGAMMSEARDERQRGR